MRELAAKPAEGVCMAGDCGSSGGFVGEITDLPGIGCGILLFLGGFCGRCGGGIAAWVRDLWNGLDNGRSV